MPESYSINDLFVKGLTREQFIEKYNEIKSSGAAPESSIFTDGMEDVVGQMFDTVDSMGKKKTSGNGVLDKDEIKELMKLAKNDDKSKLSEADLAVLYDKVAENIVSKYLEPDIQEEQIDNAISKYGKDIKNSDYVKSMDNDIARLTELLNLRRSRSAVTINDLQAQIKDLLIKSEKLKDSAEYDAKTEELNKLRKQEAENKAKIKAAEQEISDKKDDAELIKRAISELDSKKDAEKIKAKQQELSKVNSDIEGLNKKLADYNSLASKLKSDILKTNKRLVEIRTDVLNKNDRIKSQIGQLQAKIQQEKENADKDILNYEQQIDYIRTTKSYAYQRATTQTVYNGKAAPAGSVASSQNDNKMTFSELQAQGLKYSSAKGQKLAQYVGSRANGFKGYCSRHVANGLQGTGLGNERMPSACQMDDALRWDIASGKNKNFREIKVSSLEELKNLPAGCVVIYEANAAWNNGYKTGHYNAKHGHIEVTLGNGTAASDGITKNMRYSDRMSVFVPVESA